MAHGHIIPIVDMARLFARHGVKTTIFATPLTAALFLKTVERDRQLGMDITVHTTRFPATEAGLPEGCEIARSITTDMIPNFIKAVSMLQEPLEQFLQECNPSCLVADMMFAWATEVAENIGIPRLFFTGSNSFSSCVYDCLKQYEPHKRIESDFEPFIVPGIPDRIELTKSRLPPYLKENDKESVITKFMDKVAESKKKSFGVLVNSFNELEPAYAEYQSKVLGKRTWHIGPLSLCNREIKDKFERGDVASISETDCLEWLSTKKANSVLYVCFGSMFIFSEAQLLEIAAGLEQSGKDFIWVVRNKEEKAADKVEDWLPDGFLKRIEGKGLIICGWAPQMLILDHEAIGGFVTHCGWNSALEGLTAGVPIVTWPLHAEQFLNEKLITDVLKVGVSVGAQEWSRDEKKILIRKEEIRKAVVQLMDGEEAEEIRNRARKIKENAKRATEGGSSYSALNALLQELRALKTD